MIYVLGDDPDGLEQLARLKQEVGSPELRDLNTAVFDGQQIALEDLRGACEAMPFLADHRLIVIRGLLSRFESTTGDKVEQEGDETGTRKPSELVRQVADYLPRIPEQSVVAFVERVTITKHNPMYQGLQAAGARFAQTPVLIGEQLREWIERRAAAKGGLLTPGASKVLASAGVGSLRGLDVELDKLIAFANGAPIDSAAINQLVDAAQEANVYKLGDAIAEGNRPVALRQLRELLDDGKHPLYILTMVARHFRLLLQVKELLGIGLNTSAIGTRLKLREFVVERLVSQSRRYATINQLEQVHRRLLESDVASKTGQGDLVANLELIIVENATSLGAKFRRGSG